jgi:hypothetical protein
MPAPAPYIPPKDADFGPWLDNFSTLITAAPATYGLVASDATAIAAQNTAWAAAYTLAIGAGTRGTANISAKDVARVNAEAVVRPYAQQIANNVGVSVDDKIALGLNARTNPPSPIAAPNTSPILTVIGATPLGHTLRYRDEMASPSVKSKPFGVIQIQVFGMVSATVISDPTALPLLGAFTKSPVGITWDSTAVGKQAYYAARWVTRTGLVGPWSPIVTFTVANGST